MDDTVQDYVTSHGDEEVSLLGPNGRRRWPEHVKAEIVQKSFRLAGLTGSVQYALYRPGSLSIWLDPRVIWVPPPSGKRSRQQQFAPIQA